MKSVLKAMVAILIIMLLDLALLFAPISKDAKSIIITLIFVLLIVELFCLLYIKMAKNRQKRWLKPPRNNVRRTYDGRR